MDSTQRFLSSSATQSSLTKPAARSRKRSQASSAAGDSLAVNKLLEKHGNDPGCTAPRVRHSKGKVRLVPNSRKNSKAGRVLSKKFGSLQNAVVLAPFYTLKKAYQDKFLNFYTFEKMKNMNCRSKAVKNRDMSFEYDIMELKPQTLKVKREAKMTVNKTNLKTNPKGYCRCNKKKGKTVKKLTEKKGRLKRKKMCDKEHIDGGAMNFFEHYQTKRKKPNPEMMTQTLKSEFGPEQSLYISNDKSFMTKTRGSTGSSGSRSDSWDTSSREEYMEGALAISTSSFDCYLKNFDKDYWNFTEVKDNGRQAAEAIGTDFVEKPFGGCSRHLMFEKKNSDGRIVDFTDREPQTRIISAEESHQHLQPLRLQSKQKAKKPEPEAACGCHTRSLSKNHSSRATNPSDLSLTESNRAFQVEVATQVEKDTLERGFPTCELKVNLEIPANIGYHENAGIQLDKMSKEPACSSSTSLSFLKMESLHKIPLIDPETEAVENESSENKIEEAEKKENSSEDSALLEDLCPRVDSAEQ